MMPTKQTQHSEERLCYPYKESMIGAVKNLGPVVQTNDVRLQDVKFSNLLY